MIAYDTETTGLHYYHGADMFAFSTCDEEGNTSVSRVDRGKVSAEMGKTKLRRLLTEELIMHNAKFDLSFTLKFLGLPVSAVDDLEFHDTHKMAHILRNDSRHDLKTLSWQHCAYPRDDEKAVKEAARQFGGKLNYQKVPEHIMALYQRGDAERTMMLKILFWKEISKRPDWVDAYQVEMDLIKTTMHMEQRGVMLYEPRLHGLVSKLERESEEAAQVVYDVAGYRFNLNADAELRRLFFGKLGLPVINLTKKERKPSVDKVVMAELKTLNRHCNIIEAVQKARSYRKGITTVNGYLKLADSDGIIRPSINTCAAITGRQSIKRPALQTVPKEEVLLNPYPIPARRCFRAKPGKINIHVDYAGIEARLLVFYSREPEMLACLISGDGDLHSLAAAVLYGNRWTKASKAERKVLRGAAKNTNFAAPYGATNAKMMQTLGVSDESGIRAYRARFPRYTGLLRTIIKQVKEIGYVESAFGRRLYVPRDLAYMGVNYLIQGTAAEILKRAQNRVHAMGVELILCIHDEIVFEYSRRRLGDLKELMREIRRVMIDFPQFDVPLEVEASWGSVWDLKNPMEIVA